MQTEVKLKIIEEAKKYFFAEDIVSFFMISQGLSPEFRKPLTARCYRLIPRAFNDLLQIVMCYLYSRISVFSPFRSFEANGMTSTDNFFIFAQCLENKYFTAGYNAQKFLYFCSYLVYIANSFYRAGETNVPKLAVNYIVKTMNMYDVSEDELWNNLSIAAVKYTKIAFECGFAKMSDFNSMKIQFVIEQSSEEKGNIDGIAESNASNTKEESELMKLSEELDMDLSFTDDDIVYSKNNKAKSKANKYLKLLEESRHQQLSTGHTSKNAKKCLKVDENKVINEKMSQIKISKLSVISLARRKRVLEILYGKRNEETVSDFLENTFKTNPNITTEEMPCSTLNYEEESDAGLVEKDAIEINENNSKYFDESKQEIQSSTAYEQEFFPNASQKNFRISMSAKESSTKPSCSTSNDEPLFTTNSKESDIPEELSDSEESETEYCRMKTVEFDICDPFVMAMVSDETETELFGETHENFISQEDFFNGTFDILTHVHYMATTYGFAALNMAAIDY